jgi:hypothetical protein
MPVEEPRKTAHPESPQTAAGRTHAAFAQAEAMRVAVLTLLQCLPAETRERFKTQYGAKMKRLAGSATHRALPQAAIEEFQDSGQQLLEDLAP